MKRAWLPDFGLSELKRGARPVADRISLRLRRNDMNVFRTLDEPGQQPDRARGRQVCRRPVPEL